MKNISILFLVIFFVFSPIEAFSLCYQRHNENIFAEYAKSKKVLIVLVKSSTDVSSPDDSEGIDKTIYKAKVINSFKGSGEDVDIVSENTSSRFSMNNGKKYLVFLKPEKSYFFVDNCGNSGLASQQTAVISKIRDLKNK